jgi:hypothetical protein
MLTNHNKLSKLLFNQFELKNTEVFFVHPSDPKIYIAIFVWTSTIKDYKIGICCFSDKHTA